ncbi:hypothetical protein TRAPUB_9514 [Trametes pubescens]|uniref:Uncharacterized protein n=1 Tax=Trametes pubescens TaxID=154538 RepID=A0A1M2W266_TRAPU|nr:hypothetical protein TRAPUB_9514 [Trametes pubescens]
MATQASASPMPAGVTDPNYKPHPGRPGNLYRHIHTHPNSFRYTILILLTSLVDGAGEGEGQCKDGNI